MFSKRLIAIFGFLLLTTIGFSQSRLRWFEITLDILYMENFYKSSGHRIYPKSDFTISPSKKELGGMVYGPGIRIPIDRWALIPKFYSHFDLKYLPIKAKNITITDETGLEKNRKMSGHIWDARFRAGYFLLDSRFIFGVYGTLGFDYTQAQIGGNNHSFYDPGYGGGILIGYRPKGKPGSIISKLASQEIVGSIGMYTNGKDRPCYIGISIPLTRVIVSK